MQTHSKKTDFRSEIRTVKGSSGSNYLVIRFWDDKNTNWEYHVYSEVQAKKAVRDIAQLYNLDFPKNGTNPNTRELWDQLWEQKLTY